MNRSPSSASVAVFPGGGNGPAGFWRMLAAGVDATRDVPADRWDADAYYDADPDAAGRMYVRRGAFLDGVDRFDAGFFGISPREAASMDPQQRLLLEVVWEAIEDAAIPRDALAGTATGVYVGVMFHDYAQLIASAGLQHVDTYFGTGNGVAFLAGRLSYYLGLQGPKPGPGYRVFVVPGGGAPGLPVPARRRDGCGAGLRSEPDPLAAVEPW